MTFLIQQTLIYAVPLMIVALAGVFAERSGIINLALEGIMIFGAFAGVLFVNVTQKAGIFSEAKAAGDWVAMLVAAILGAVFSLLLSFASVNLKADQTIGGTALNLMAPALVLFFIRIIANQNTLQMAEGDAASWFMLKKSFFGYGRSDEMGFFGDTFINKAYLATYICIILFVVLSILLYKTRFGLRLRSCGENPQAADSLGINVQSTFTVGIDLEAALANPGSDADIVLRAGDVISVPEYNNTVKIDGAVMMPNTVSFKEGEGVKYYINQAGGYGQNAKKSKKFIIYMNGQIAQVKGSGKKQMEPGCEIIVPSKRKKQFNIGNVVGLTSSIASLATMTAAITALIK